MKQIRLQNTHLSSELFNIPSTDLKHFIKLYINSLWKIFLVSCYTGELGCILFKIKSTYFFYFNLLKNAAPKLLFQEFVSVTL